MGARVIRKPDIPARRKKQTLIMWAIMAAVGSPIFLAYILVAMDMRADLSELKPARHASENGVVPVGWEDLGQRSVPGRVRMIGYMMDGYSRRTQSRAVDMFVLLPEAGHFLHPAHRVPNQMVEVWPNHLVHFEERELVWVEGTLNRTIGRHADDTAAWAMGDAEVIAAAPREIATWFQP